MQTATIMFGICFLIIKYFEWIRPRYQGESIPIRPALLNQGKGDILFFSLYYVMTGIHGIHVMIGVITIAIMSIYTWRGIIDRDNFAKLENTGLYWHFVDIVWIYLFPLFYLIT